MFLDFENNTVIIIINCGTHVLVPKIMEKVLGLERGSNLLTLLFGTQLKPQGARWWGGKVYNDFGAHYIYLMKTPPCDDTAHVQFRLKV